MKKILTILLISTVSLFSLFAEEPLQQYQTFRWSKVDRASKYGVEVQMHDAAGSWNSIISETTTDTDCEVLLYPGNYRVSISTYNVLGKKASSTDWVDFTILDESEPYIFDDSFTDNASYGTPVLHIAVDGDNFSYGKENSIAAVEDYVANSFLLKGKNFFFPETRFFLKPSNRPVAGMSGEPFVQHRKTAELSVIRRDREKDGIYLSYNVQNLFTGYYDFVIENPGNNRITKEVFVIAERDPVIEKETLNLNKRYRAADVTIERRESTIFSVTGFGFDSKTKYSFVPTDEGYKYPFASSFERSEVYLSVNSTNDYGSDGCVTVDFAISSLGMQTGYYNFTATNANGKSCTQKYLVTVEEVPEIPAPVITGVSAKTKKGVSKFTIKGENFSSDIKLTLIAPVAEGKGDNNMIPLEVKSVKKDGKKIDAECKGLGSGYYAVLVETVTASSITYFEISEKLTASVASLDVDSVDEIFMRPEEKEVVAVQADMEMPDVSAYGANGSVVSLSPNTQELPDNQFAFCTGISMIFIPANVTTIGRYVFNGWTEDQTIFLNWEPDDSLRHYIKDEAFAGCNAVIRYNDGTPYTRGSWIPSTAPAYGIEDNADLIEKDDAETWRSFYRVENDILTIMSDVAWTYNATWRKEKNFTKVFVAEGVTKVCDDAFRNCTNIVEVYLSSTVSSIGYEAFSGCTNLKRVTMPRVNTVSPLSTRIVSVLDDARGAFYGCSSLCEIKLIDAKEKEAVEKLRFVNATLNGNPITGSEKRTNRLFFSHITLKPALNMENMDSLEWFGDVSIDLVNFRDAISLAVQMTGPYAEGFIGVDNNEEYSRTTMFKIGPKFTLNYPSDSFHLFVSAAALFPWDMLGRNKDISHIEFPVYYFPFEIGARLGGIFEFTYCLTLNVIHPSPAFNNGSKFFTEHYTLGFRLPLAPKHYIGNVVNQTYVDFNDTIETISLEYNYESNNYRYEQPFADMFGKLPEKKSELNIEWYAICNKDIKRLKIKIYDVNQKTGELVDISPDSEVVIEDIKAGVPFSTTLKMPIAKKCKKEARLVLSCESEDTDGVPSFKSLNRR